MTWEVDIVQRAGRLIVSGEFKIRDAAEATTFILRFNDVIRRAGIIVAMPAQEPTVIVDKGGRPPIALRDDRPRSGELTPRETEIFDLVESGLSTPEIAKQLGISPNTVYFNKAVIRRKQSGEVKPPKPFLSDEQAALWNAHESGQSIRQIADRTGRNPDAVKSALYRIRDKLSKRKPS